MEIMKVSEYPLGEVLQSAVGILLSGGIVAYPTETFYALGVKFDLEESLKRLYDLKQRSLEKALPLIIGDRKLLYSLSSAINGTAVSLMDRFWPGPLTLVFPAAGNLSGYLTAGTQTVAVRIPGESFALQLARCARFPLTATSANIPARPHVVELGGAGDDVVTPGAEIGGTELRVEFRGMRCYGILERSENHSIPHMTQHMLSLRSATPRQTEDSVLEPLFQLVRVESP